ncbi:hypothetical protein J1N35_036612, partial [Gossypium stocksii]
SWVMHELECQKVEELSKAITVTKSLLELNVKKSEKFESSKPKFKPNGNSVRDKDKGKRITRPEKLSKTSHGRKNA